MIRPENNCGPEPKSEPAAIDNRTDHDTGSRLPISPEHIVLLSDAAISLDVALAAGVRSALDDDQVPEHARWAGPTPGLVFPWAPLHDGETIDQYRPDVPVADDDDKPIKYVWPGGVGLVLGVHPWTRTKLDHGTGPVVLVEGTKQTLAAVTAAAAGDNAVVGMVGCWGWRCTDFASWRLAGRDVVVILDADFRTNRQVWDAAAGLKAALETKNLAGVVSFVDLPGGGKTGLDDFLAHCPDAAASFASLVDRARKSRKKDLPPRPGSPLLDRNRLRSQSALAAILLGRHFAVDAGRRLMAFDAGRYVHHPLALDIILNALLGEEFEPAHVSSAHATLVANLYDAGRVIPDQPVDPLISVTNGLLDPLGRVLSAHDPDRLDVVQLAVEWNPEARCPLFDAWLDEVAGHQAQDLLEAVATMVDRRPELQRKAVMLYGPSRSGKSTLIHVVEALVRPVNRSAVSLHQMAEDQFARAELYGSLLNTSADLPARYIEDLSYFKQLVGGDRINVARKYGHPFDFRFYGLCVFSMNEVPVVNEASRAYFARVRPFHFSRSFEGAEDPSREAAIMGELPGILVRVVDALGEMVRRGGYRHDATTVAAMDDFAARSDNLRMFLSECTVADADGWLGRSALSSAYARWAEISRKRALSLQRLYRAMAGTGYQPAKRDQAGWRGLRVLPESEWFGDGAPVEVLREIMGQASRPEEPESISDPASTTSQSHAELPEEPEDLYTLRVREGEEEPVVDRKCVTHVRRVGKPSETSGRRTEVY